MNKICTYLKSILIPLIVGGVVGLIVSNSIDYNSLVKPLISPPSIAFPIVWTILYLLMGISYGILKSNSLTDEKIDNIYYIQLAINALWPIFFFVFQWRLFAFFWILLLIVSIIIMINRFFEKNRTSAYLQLPYLLWTIFAAYLNLSIYLLNK